jgi:hypothetical protein
MIKSIVDGFAFDLQRETYCYGGEALYQYQVSVCVCVETTKRMRRLLLGCEFLMTNGVVLVNLIAVGVYSERSHI